MFAHTQRLLPIFAALLLLFSSITFAAPVKSRSALQRRQEALDIFNEAMELMNDIQDIVSDISDIDTAQHDAESQFTQVMLSNLMAQYPCSNVIIYHDGDCGYSLVNDQNAFVEFDIGLGMTQGYYINVFDSGIFTLVGDGGWLNWAYGGNYVQDGNDLTFSTMCSR